MRLKIRATAGVKLRITRFRSRKIVRDPGALEQIVQIAIDAVYFFDLVAQLGVDDVQFLVGRLHFLFRSFELLVGRLQFFVDREQLLVGRAEFLVGGFQLLDGRLQSLPGLPQFLLDLLNRDVLVLGLLGAGLAGALAGPRSVKTTP